MLGHIHKYPSSDSCNRGYPFRETLLVKPLPTFSLLGESRVPNLWWKLQNNPTLVHNYV